ncbi:hypothetical protein HMPREF2743_00280 [Corynebacterium sp. HMSC036D02]|nr:hypothetical protein HMPREF2743_00280 [Corynebacterium sp. HMSC036D02]
MLRISTIFLLLSTGGTVLFLGKLPLWSISRQQELGLPRFLLRQDQESLRWSTFMYLLMSYQLLGKPHGCQEGSSP